MSSRGSTRLSRKALREIPDGDKRLINVVHSSSPVSGQRLTFLSNDICTILGLSTVTFDIDNDFQNQSYEAKKYQMVDDTFDEEHMLQYLRREQECGSSMMEDGRVTSHTNRSDHRKHYEHEVCGSSFSSPKLSWLYNFFYSGTRAIVFDGPPIPEGGREGGREGAGEGEREELCRKLFFTVGARHD